MYSVSFHDKVPSKKFKRAHRAGQSEYYLERKLSSPPLLKGVADKRHGSSSKRQSVEKNIILQN